MKTKIGFALSALLWSVGCAQALTIDVGSYFLLANQANQQITISVHGGNLITGTDINVQIGASLAPAAPPHGPSPTISYLGYTGNVNTSDVTGGIVSVPAHFLVDSTSSVAPYAVTVSEVVSNTNSPIVAEGALITLVIDTTGFSSGTYPLIMGSANFNDSTDFFTVAGNVQSSVPVSINDGSITIVPEPASLVLGLLAIAALGVLAVCKRRAHRDCLMH